MANVFDLVEDADILIGVFFYYFELVTFKFCSKGSEKKGKADVGKRAIRDNLQLFSNHRFSCAVTEG